jgi:hypothetical protein
VLSVASGAHLVAWRHCPVVLAVLALPFHHAVKLVQVCSAAAAAAAAAAEAEAEAAVTKHWITQSNHEAVRALYASPMASHRLHHAIKALMVCRHSRSTTALQRHANHYYTACLHVCWSSSTESAQPCHIIQNLCRRVLLCWCQITPSATSHV